MTNSNQFSLFLVLQWIVAGIIAMTFAPVSTLPIWLKAVFVVTIPLTQLIALVISLGLLNTLNWSGARLIIASTIVEVIVVFLALSMVSRLFAGTYYAGTPHIVTAIILALAGAPLVNLITGWLGENYAHFLGYLQFGSWAFAQWLFAYVLGGVVFVNSPYLKTSDALAASLATIFIQLILTAMLYGIGKGILKLKRKRYLYISIWAGSAIFWIIALSVVSGDLAVGTLGLPMSVLTIPVFARGD